MRLGLYVFVGFVITVVLILLIKTVVCEAQSKL